MHHFTEIFWEKIQSKVSNFLLSKTTLFVLYLKLTVWNLRNRPTVVVVHSWVQRPSAGHER